MKFKSEVKTEKYKTFYNVAQTERSIKKEIQGKKIALKDVELLLDKDTIEKYDFKVTILSPYNYRVSWTGRPNITFEVIIEITDRKNILSFNEDEEEEKLEVKNMLTINPKEVVKKVQSGEIFLEAEYQRDFVWSKEKKIDFVKNWIKGTIFNPYLVSYTDENDNHIYEVVDGKQRFNAIYEFLNNELEVNGLYFKDLLPYDKYNIVHSKISGIVMTQTKGENAYRRPSEKVLVKTFLNLNSGVPISKEVIEKAQKMIGE